MAINDDYMRKISEEAQRIYEERNGIVRKDIKVRDVNQEKKEIKIPKFIAEGKRTVNRSLKRQKYKRKRQERSWKRVKRYRKPKNKIDEQLLKRISISLTVIGLASAIGFAGVTCKKLYDKGYELTEHFWDDTKERMAKIREEKELLYGDTFPNGEKKRKITHKEWEELPGDSKKYIQEPPEDIDEERE